MSNEKKFPLSENNMKNILVIIKSVLIDRKRRDRKEIMKQRSQEKFSDYAVCLFFCLSLSVPRLFKSTHVQVIHCLVWYHDWLK